MVTIYGVSDDLVEIDGSEYRENEIDCYEKDVRIQFNDGTLIRVGYPKEGKAVWWIEVEQEGTAHHHLAICEDEEQTPYSDVFVIDAEILSHSVIKQKYQR